MTKIPDEANALHQEGRKAGGAGNPVRALELFFRAHQLAPDWAYPMYDMAFTYLLGDDLAEAEKWYAAVDKLEPRGFFTSKTSLDTVRRERRGELPAGFSKAFAMLEWEPPERQRGALQQIVKRYPTFAPAWQRLSSLIEDDDDARLVAIEHGLAAKPDDETYSVLVVNKALVLDRRGQKTEAKQLLKELIADKRCTTGGEAMAKLSLPGGRKTN
jgi:tetratricopeptide (TPR) repeat protein